MAAAAAGRGSAVGYAGAHGSGPFGALALAALAGAGIEVLQPPKAGPGHRVRGRRSWTPGASGRS